MQLVTLKTFDNPIDAHLLQSKLDNEGIESFLLNENMIGLNPLFNNVLGVIQLKINANDLEVSILVVNEINNTPLTDERKK